jgi:hypothetical protein
MTRSGSSAGAAAYKIALKTSGPVGMRGNATQRLANARSARGLAHMSAGRKPTRIALGAGTLMAAGAMRPGPNQSRTGYSGPMQPARGTGRYA